MRRKASQVTITADFPDLEIKDSVLPDFGPATGLICRECGSAHRLGAAYACDECFGPLEVQYDFGQVTRDAP